jgi:hypothetical protein
MSSSDDGFVFLRYLAHDRIEIGLVGFVIGVEHGRRDDAGRGRIHEPLGGMHVGFLRLTFRAVDFLLQLLFAVIAELGDRLGRVEHLAGLRDALHHPLGEFRELDEFPAERPARFAAESVHALGHVGLKADPALLAVIGDVDADFGLFFHDVGNAIVRQLVDFLAIDPFALFLVDQHRAQGFTARHAAGMRGEDSFVAEFHRTLLPIPVSS